MVPLDKRTQEIICRFQDSLSTLRKVAGWSAEDLGKQLDVTRQTIVNLETGRIKMTKIQYLAIRMAFQREIEEHENKTLEKVLVLLVDAEGLDQEHRNQVKMTVDSAAKRPGRRAGASMASKAAIEVLAPLLAGAAFAALLSPVGMVGSVIGGMAGAGLFKVFREDSEK